MAARGKGAQTRRRILMSAAELIATRGVAKTSLADVVEVAKVSKGALYFHFSSKEELLIGLEALYNADSLRMIEQVSRDPDPVRRLIRLSLALARRQNRDRLANAHERLMLSRLAPPMPADLTLVDWAAVMRPWIAGALQQSGDTALERDLQTVAEIIDDCLLGAVTAGLVEPRSTTLITRIAGLWRWLALPSLVPDPDRRAELLRFLDALEAWSETEVARPVGEEDDVHAEPLLPDANATEPGLAVVSR